MNRYRHCRLRTRLGILALVALLWSQVILVAHPACSMAAMALGEIPDPVATGHGCHDPAPYAGSAVCEAHCSQGAQSNEVGRIPPVPALAPVPAIGFSAIVMLEADRASCDGLPLLASWHRPTSHPASVLLI